MFRSNTYKLSEFEPGPDLHYNIKFETILEDRCKEILQTEIDPLF